MDEERVYENITVIPSDGKCLEEDNLEFHTTREHPQDDKQESCPINKIYLDTKGLCFFCNKSNSALEEEAEYLLGEKSMQKICHYLGISQSNIFFLALNETLDKEEGSGDSTVKCEFSVTLCKSCTSVAQKLSELIEQLELTRMLLEHQTQVFHSILRSSKNHIKTTNCTPPVSVDEADLVNEQLVKTFRLHITLKSE